MDVPEEAVLRACRLPGFSLSILPMNRLILESASSPFCRLPNLSVLVLWNVRYHLKMSETGRKLSAWYHEGQTAERGETQPAIHDLLLAGC